MTYRLMITHATAGLEASGPQCMFEGFQAYQYRQAAPLGRPARSNMLPILLNLLLRHYVLAQAQPHLAPGPNLYRPFRYCNKIGLVKLQQNVLRPLGTRTERSGPAVGKIH